MLGEQQCLIELSNVRSAILSRDQLRQWLTAHQRRLRVGDELPTLTELAQRAGIHRDTVYALLSGDRICIRSQYGLSRVIAEIEEETQGQTKTRVMSVSLGSGSAQLRFGCASSPILSKRTST